MRVETTSLNLSKGLHNKSKAESIPEGFLSSIVNVDIDSAGNLSLRPGKTSAYTGTGMHSYWERTPLSDRYFVEEGVLKRFELDGTATIIKTGIGDLPLSYSSIADRIYYSNGVISGSIVNGVYQDWGLTRPPFQAIAKARQAGDMFAGDYQIAVTWLRNREESGTILASKVTVSDGGGIVLSDFPAPPSEIDQIGIYVTSHDGEKLWLYGKYPASMQEIFIDKKISNIPLRTQFGYKPNPFKIVQAHYGQVFGVIGKNVHRSNNHNYGLFKHNNYWPFPKNVTALISLPGGLYVGTEDRLYRVTNINGEGIAVVTAVKEYGITFTRNYPYDADNEIAYVRSTKGDIAITSEGITELTATNVAMANFRETIITLIESNGKKKLLASSKGVIKESNLKVTT